MRPHYRLFIALLCLFGTASCHTRPAPEPEEETVAADTLMETDTVVEADTIIYTLDHLSEYDPLIQRQAEKMGWDWRLLASLIYQESRFNPNLVNEKGAFGLMQLMPVIMENYGIDSTSTIEEQLDAAGRLLKYLDRNLSQNVTDSLERKYFVLAGYNAGLNNVLKAMVRAEGNGKNGAVWFDNVEHYCPRQTYFFVRDITERYALYKTMIR